MLELTCVLLTCIYLTQVALPSDQALQEAVELARTQGSTALKIKATLTAGSLEPITGSDSSSPIPNELTNTAVPAVAVATSKGPNKALIAGGIVGTLLAVGAIAGFVLLKSKK